VHIATFPLAAIRKCRFEVGQSALVMGVGVLGILGIKLLYASGAHPIIAADPVPEKRELALSLGADYALDPLSPDFAKTVKEITGGGVDVVLEITGKGAGLDTALDCVRPRASVALLGCTRSSDFSIDYYRKVHGPGVTLVGAHTAARPKQESSNGWWTERDDAKAIIGLLAGNRLDFASLVEEVYTTDRYKEVYEKLASAPSFPIVQFDWSDME
jgi:threonine dehydrogenase-like Zn-dependent dehydrogenase